MARNEEKAQSLMNRWTAMKADFSGLGDRRPFIASDCKSLGEAEKWRRQLVNEISSKVNGIQNASAGEHAIREMNDKINRLFREKWHWDKRVCELGGMRRTTLPVGVEEGARLPGSGTYRYFGAAKNLPGVRELLEAMEQPKKPKRKIPIHLETLNPDYYGYRDEVTSPELLVLEAKTQDRMRSERSSSSSIVK